MLWFLKNRNESQFSLSWRGLPEEPARFGQLIPWRFLRRLFQWQWWKLVVSLSRRKKGPQEHAERVSEWGSFCTLERLDTRCLQSCTKTNWRAAIWDRDLVMRQGERWPNTIPRCQSNFGGTRSFRRQRLCRWEERSCERTLQEEFLSTLMLFVWPDACPAAQGDEKSQKLHFLIHLRTFAEGSGLDFSRVKVSKVIWGEGEEMDYLCKFVDVCQVRDRETTVWTTQELTMKWGQETHRMP